MSKMVQLYLFGFCPVRVLQTPVGSRGLLQPLSLAACPLSTPRAAWVLWVLWDTSPVRHRPGTKPFPPVDATEGKGTSLGGAGAMMNDRFSDASDMVAGRTLGGTKVPLLALTSGLQPYPQKGG